MSPQIKGLQAFNVKTLLGSNIISQRYYCINTMVLQH